MNLHQCILSIECYRYTTYATEGEWLMNQSVETIKEKEEEKKRGGREEEREKKKRKCMNRKKNIS